MSEGNQPGAMALTRTPRGAHFQARSRVERHDTALARGIGHGVHLAGARAVEGGHRGDVDHRSAAVLEHRAGDRLGDEEQPTQVDVDHLLPAIAGCLLGRSSPGGAGVVDEHVDLAELVDRRFDQPFDVSGLRTSHESASDRTPSFSSSAAVCWQRSILLAETTMFEPSSARASAIWRPRPLPPPVTIAVWPDRSNSSWRRRAAPERIQFSMSPLVPNDHLELRGRYRAFMEEHVYPNEAGVRGRTTTAGCAHRGTAGARRRTPACGPRISARRPGARGRLPLLRVLNEVIGRSYWGQLVFGCQAPDAGNGEILHLFGTTGAEGATGWRRSSPARCGRSSDDRARGLGRRPHRPGVTARARRRRLGDRWPQVVLDRAEGPLSASSWR